jgi:hypothetical protein
VLACAHHVLEPALARLHDTHGAADVVLLRRVRRYVARQPARHRLTCERGVCRIGKQAVGRVQGDEALKMFRNADGLVARGCMMRSGLRNDAMSCESGSRRTSSTNCLLILNVRSPMRTSASSSPSISERSEEDTWFNMWLAFAGAPDRHDSTGLRNLL